MPSACLKSRGVLLTLILVGLSACGEPRSWSEITVPASDETAPVMNPEDAADDAAVWVHPLDPSESLVLGTDKKGGLHVFGMDGEQRAFHQLGPINNVDLRQGVRLGGRERDVGVASLRRTTELVYFELDSQIGTFSGYGRIPTEHHDPYGICLGRIGSVLVAFVTYKDGTLQSFEITEGLPLPDARPIGEVKLGGQIEGCVFDDIGGRLFVAEEDRGIHVFEFDLKSGLAQASWVDRVRRAGPLMADVEGLAVVRDTQGPLLIASAQGISAFVIYDGAPPFEVRAVLRIGADEVAGVDAVTHTDGLELVAVQLGPEYKCGLLVVQDDDNSPFSQNFKLVDWCRVSEQLAAKAAP